MDAKTTPPNTALPPKKATVTKKKKKDPAVSAQSQQVADAKLTTKDSKWLVREQRRLRQENYKRKVKSLDKNEKDLVVRASILSAQLLNSPKFLADLQAGTLDVSQHLNGILNDESTKTSPSSERDSQVAVPGRSLLQVYEQKKKQLVSLVNMYFKGRKKTTLDVRAQVEKRVNLTTLQALPFCLGRTQPRKDNLSFYTSGEFHPAKAVQCLACALPVDPTTEDLVLRLKHCLHISCQSQIQNAHY